MSVALAAPHPVAVAAGETVARAGGNALDTALAAAIALTVAYPHQCAIGGDLIALVRAPDGSTTAVIGAGTAPAAIGSVSGEWAAVPRAGAHSVTVPGMVAGWTAIAGLGASLPLAGAFARAALIAREGVEVSAGLRRGLVSRRDAVLADVGMAGVFAPDGEILAEGATVYQPALADTLERLAEDPSDFYGGETARSIVATLRAQGGVHEDSDFASYEAEVLPALTLETPTATWSVAPPPSAGAVLLGVIAAQSEGSMAGDLVASCVRGVHARAAYLGDPAASDIDLDAILHLRRDSSPASAEPRPQGDTACVTAIDDEGWAVTIVQSVYQTFGSGVLDPATGVLLHNRGSAFSVDDSSPARIRPGSRPPHTLTPAIVDTDEVTVIAGCQGGRAQPWILAQLLPDAARAETDLGELLARPRWVVGDRDLGRDRLTLVAEPGVATDVLDAARASDVDTASFDGASDEAGHVQLVRSVRHVGLDAASDPRADGSGIVANTDHRRESAETGS